MKSVEIDLNNLVQQLEYNHLRRQYRRNNEELLIRVYVSDVHCTERTSTELNGQFIHFQLLIDCIIRMKPSSNEKQMCTAYLEEKYRNKPSELYMIEAFEKEYMPCNAINWYTKQSFLFKHLNKALRDQDIELLYLLGFYIRDLADQLENNRCSSLVHVYRAQKMFKDEVEMIKNSIGQFISVNCFFSTSLKKRKALSFLESGSINNSNEVEKVFFKIDADPRLKNIKPFSKIDSSSEFPDEHEILFMIGSIFQIIDVKFNKNGRWDIRLRLCSNNDDQLQTLLEYKRKRLGSGETNLYMLANILQDMGRLNDAEKYYLLYLHQLSDNDPHISACYHALGILTSQKGDYESSVTWYKKLDEINARTLKSDDLSAANIHNSIGTLHQETGDNTKALKSFKKALDIWINAYGEDHPDVAMCFSNVGNLYQDEKNYSKALKYHQKALTIYQKQLPNGHPAIGTSYTNIGNIYFCLDQHDVALKHYESSLKIYKKSLPSYHPHIAMTHENIGLIYESEQDFQKALFHFQKALDIFRHSLLPTHHKITQLEQSIKQISSQLSIFF